MDVYKDVDPAGELLRLDGVAAQLDLEHWLMVEGLAPGNRENISEKWRRIVVEAQLIARTAVLPLPEYIRRCFTA